jgi:hypothetical protein
MSIKILKTGCAELIDKIASNECSLAALGASSASLLHQAAKWGGRKVTWIVENTWPQYFLSALELPWGACFIYKSGILPKIRSWCRFTKENPMHETAVNLKYLAAGSLLIVDGLARIMLTQMHSDRSNYIPCSERLKYLKQDMETCPAAKEIYNKFEQYQWKFECGDVPDGTIQIYERTIVAGDETHTTIPVTLFYADSLLEKYSVWQQMETTMCKKPLNQFVEDMQHLNFEIKKEAYQNLKKCKNWSAWATLEKVSDFEIYKDSSKGRKEAQMLTLLHREKCFL